MGEEEVERKQELYKVFKRQKNVVLKKDTEEDEVEQRRGRGL